MNMQANRGLALAGVLSAAVMATFPGAAQAQWTPGPRVGQNPDVIVSSVGGSYDSTSGISFYGVSGGISSYAIGSDSCNIGNAPAIWVTSRSPYASTDDFGAPFNQHPVIGGAVYRLWNGRFEQIGMSWLKHGYCAADSCSTGNNATTANRGCTLVGGNAAGQAACVVDLGNTHQACAMLGFGRATDTYGSTLNGAQGDLGPRSEVQPWTAVFPFPFVLNGSNPVACLNKRLLVRNADLDPANYPRYNATTAPTGAQYFSEVVYIQPDEWPTERYDNYSYRRLTVGATTSTSTASGCTGAYFALSFATGTGNLTVPLHPALDAWKSFDPSVVNVVADAPNDGRYSISAKVTDLGNGTWQYEYAVFNMNSDRACSSFSIPKSASSSVVISQMGFHQPEYHSGEPYSQTPWSGALSGGAIAWTGGTWATSQNDNAIRWSTLYNFRFIANQPPKSTAVVRLGLFKPAVQVGDADFIDVAGLPTPGDPPCRADFNGMNGITIQDIFDFLNAWFGGSPSADFNGGGLTVSDIFDFLNSWFAGCP
jgi:hypothetical protein